MPEGPSGGAATTKPLGVESDSETAKLQDEWERVRRQRLALEKQQKRARNGRDKSDSDAEDLTNDNDSQEAEDAMLVALPSQPSNDPFACCCRPLKLKKLGQSYILRERRVVKNGRVTTERILVGPHWVGVLVTLSIVLGCTGLFLHQQCTLLPWYYTLYTLGFCSMTLYYLFNVACKDPGIVLPSNATKLQSTQNILHPEQEDRTTIVVDQDEDINDENVPTDDLESGGARSRPTNIHRSNTNTNNWLPPRPTNNGAPPPSYYARFQPRVRYCDICEVAQDAHTDHCDDCGVCIEELDHHCPWMGKCIGKHTMYAFKMFNVSWVVYVVFVLFVSIQNVDWGDAAVQRLHRVSTGEWVPLGPTEAPH